MMQNISYLNVYEKDVSAVEVPNILRQNSGCQFLFQIACLFNVLSNFVKSLPTVYFCMLFLSSAEFFFISFSKNYFRKWNTIKVSNSLDLDQAGQNVGPGLGPKCLQRLSADDTKLQL